MKKKRVVVGMSGGVDSAVAAYLLKEQGYEVLGLFMKNWEDDDDDAYCSTREDLIDATSVADVLDIEIEAVNFAAEYKDRVFAEFLREYQAGRTPNPDVLCNAEIKFKAFLDYAMALGAEAIATGHYARVVENNGRFDLLRGLDTSKDQSYFLHRLNQAQLSKTLFPIGELAKTRVRQIATGLKLHVASKRDSTGICFIGERPFREFLKRYLATQPGPIKTPEGKIIGEHVGLAFYTLGQRKGIGVGGVRESVDAPHQGQPWFVAAKDMVTNTLIVARGHDHRLLYATTLEASNIAFVQGSVPQDGPYTAKTRYRQTDASCTLRANGSAFTLHFDEPQWAVTPGQSAVIYQGERCLGGGIIDGTSRFLAAATSIPESQAALS